MNKKVTITDVAQAAGVSISTVHQALNNKSGVSAATREHIQRLAAEMGYQPNRMASVLKRRTQHIAVLLPKETGRNRYYFPPLWQGVRDYLQEASDWSVDCIEFQFSDEFDPQNAPECKRLRAMLQERQLDGFLTAGNVELLTPEEWQEMVKADIPVVRVGFERAEGRSLCCVQPDYEMIGRTMAELIFRQIPTFGSVVLCGGNPKWEQHSYIVKGFRDYMQEIGAVNRIYLDESFGASDEARQHILDLLENPDVAACASVYAQGSVMLAEALERCGKARKVFAVGSDVFDESVASLREGVFDNLMNKNQYAQGYLGMKSLLEYIMLGKSPEDHTINVGSEVVFRSNASIYTAARPHGSMLL